MRSPIKSYNLMKNGVTNVRLSALPLPVIPFGLTVIAFPIPTQSISLPFPFPFTTLDSEAFSGSEIESSIFILSSQEENRPLLSLIHL